MNILNRTALFFAARVVSQTHCRATLARSSCFTLAVMIGLGAMSQAADAPAPVNSPEAPLPAKVDLRPMFERWGLARRQQGTRPTCSAFTVAGALEFAASKQENHGTRLSIEFLNWASNQRAGDRLDGGFFSDLWSGFATYGICREETMPYQSVFEPDRLPPAAALADAKTRLSLDLQMHWIKPWDVTTGLTDAQFTEIKRTLHQQWPVCGGFRWPKSEHWENGVLGMATADAVRDGHSILLVGYQDDPAQPGGGLFLFRNTTREGQDGSMPYAYAREFMNDAIWVDYRTESPQTVR